MSLYAYSKRKQADQHLEIGGFVYDEAIVTKKKLKGLIQYEVNTSNAHQLTKNDIGNIISQLTKDQIGYADEMQAYLSKNMAAKGNK